MPRKLKKLIHSSAQIQGYSIQASATDAALMQNDHARHMQLTVNCINKLLAYASKALQYREVD